jgi:hypothetical protein
MLKKDGSHFKHKPSHRHNFTDKSDKSHHHITHQHSPKTSITQVQKQKSPQYRKGYNMDSTNPSNPRIGPIPLPAFIAMCIFAPFFVGVSCWVVYSHTMKKYRTQRAHKKQDVEMARLEAGGEAKVSRSVETQVRGFVEVTLH